MYLHFGADNDLDYTCIGKLIERTAQEIYDKLSWMEKMGVSKAELVEMLGGTSQAQAALTVAAVKGGPDSLASYIAYRAKEVLGVSFSTEKQAQVKARQPAMLAAMNSCAPTDEAFVTDETKPQPSADLAPVDVKPPAAQPPPVAKAGIPWGVLLGLGALFFVVRK